LIDHRVSAAVVFDDTWHHITWVDAGGTVKLYVDGVLDTANFNYTPAGAFTFNTTALGTLVRAAVAMGNIFIGAIDDVAVWKRALTEAEVNEVRTSGIPPITQVVAPAFVKDLTPATRQVGDWHIFTVDVSGTRPLSFQWFKNGQEIAGATEQSYRISNLTPASSTDKYNDYQCGSIGYSDARCGRQFAKWIGKLLAAE
jgi:hypothetical protein